METSASFTVANRIFSLIEFFSLLKIEFFLVQLQPVPLTECQLSVRWPTDVAWCNRHQYTLDYLSVLYLRYLLLTAYGENCFLIHRFPKIRPK